MRVTIQDIALRLQLSPATVSRVLNRRADSFISEATRKRVLKAAAEMGYRPNRAARALATGTTHLVLLATSRARSPYYTKVMYQLQDELRRDGYDLIMGQMGRDDEEGLNAPGLSEWPSDGIIAVDVLAHLRPYLQNSLLLNTPFLRLGNTGEKTTDYVALDLYSGAVEAVQHLAAIGCRRIGYLTGQGGGHAGDARYDAYTASMRELGREPECILCPCETKSAARAALHEYAQKHGCPDGIFCFNDDLALAGYRALCDLRRRVPEDVALVGCDGIEDIEYLETPLTTLALPVEQMCALAWEYLKRRMADPAAPLQQTIMKPHLEIRASSRR
jgi:LacI family transcriptional regulator